METTFTTEPVPPDTSLLEAAEAVLSQQIAPSPFALRDDHEFKVAAPKGPVEAQIERNQDKKAVEQYTDRMLQNIKTATHSHFTSSTPEQIATDWRNGRIPAIQETHSPSPGSPDSPYRKCSCLAVMPGRTCNRCLGSKWVKPCPKCEGQGRTDMSRRKGSERSQPCGFCMATGQVSAGKAEIARAEEMARIPAVEPAVVQDGVPATAFRRAARLPGIGSPEKKRKGKPGRRPKKAATN